MEDLQQWKADAQDLLLVQLRSWQDHFALMLVGHSHGCATRDQVLRHLALCDHTEGSFFEAWAEGRL